MADPAITVTMRDTVTLKPDRAAYGGRSVARLEGRVVMISGAIPGETVEARIDEEKKDYSTATAVSIIEPSKDRVTPDCRYFGDCGGCHLQYASIRRQVQLKEEVLSDCLRRVGNIETGLSEPLTGEPWGYRLRGQFKVSGGKAGFYRERTRDVVDIDSCPLMAREVNDAYGRARPLTGGFGVNELHITCGDTPVALVKAERMSGRESAMIANSLLENGFSGVCVSVGNRKAAAYGRRYTTFDIEGLRYTVSPASFFQSNWGLNRALVRHVMDALRPLEGKRVLDLYSGAGNFSLPIAVHAGDVTAVEQNRGAVADGRRNLKINGLGNCRFVRSDVESTGVSGPVDILVTDPPRAGLTNRAVEFIRGLRPRTVIYVSCNPSTFARDLNKLCPPYGLESVRLVDFFPQTFHIESVAFLELR